MFRRFFPFIYLVCLYTATSYTEELTLGKLVLQGATPAFTKKNITVTEKKWWQGGGNAIHLTAPELNQSQKLLILYNESSNLSLTKTEENRAVDLELFNNHGANSQATLLNIIGENKMSCLGTVQLSRMIARPCNNTTEIQQRQKMIRLFYEQDELRVQLMNNIQKLKSQESQILSFWTKQNSLVESCLKKYYYSTDFLNTTLGLSGRSIIGEALLAFQAGSAFLIPIILSTLNRCLLEWGGASQEAIDEQDQLMQYISAIKKVYEAIRTGEFAALPREDQIIIPSVLAFPLLIAGGVTILNAKNARDIFNMNCNVSAYMQEQLIAVANVIETVNTILKVCDEHPTYANGLEHLQKSRQLLEQKGTSLSSLLGNLQTNTFRGSSSYFSINGRIRATYRMMQTLKDELTPFFSLIGELEALLYAAHLMKETNEKNASARMCFVEFVDEGRPYLKLDNFWNPFVGADKAVVNSIELGVNNTRNMLLTGSNTGGKSTTEKAMMLSVLLGHIFGISFASDARMTLFSYLGTSLRILDDIASKKSLFKSEVEQAKYIERMLKTLQSGLYAFVIIDELFVGTAASVGEKAAFNFAQKLAIEYPNAIVIFVTHFPLLTQLEPTTGGIYKNFKQEVFKNEHGELVRPYKLEYGISTHNIAQDLIEEADEN